MGMKILAMATLFGIGVYMGFAVTHEPEPPTAAKICQKAAIEHRLVYTMAVCIKAENEGMEDY